MTLEDPLAASSLYCISDYTISIYENIVRQTIPCMNHLNVFLPLCLTECLAVDRCTNHLRVDVFDINYCTW